LGYTVPVRTTEYAFSDGDLEGLVVTFRANPPLDDYFDLVELAEAAATSKGLEPVRALLRGAARVGLVSWNLENGSGPVPATPENFTGHIPPIDGMNLVKRYLSEIGGLPGPLAMPSGGGKPSAKPRAKSRRPSSSVPS
jgi:hypothetical protein